MMQPMDAKKLALVLALSVGCGGVTQDADSGVAPGQDASRRDTGTGDPTDVGPPPPRDAARFDGGSTAPMGTLSAAIRIDHLGWRPDDTKTVVLLGHAHEMVEIRSVRDNSVAGTYTSGAASMDAY